MPGTTTHRRLLVLDDDRDIARLIGGIARTAGFETRAVATPDDFFAAVDDWSPSHIAVDLIMPVMDGVEVLRALAERGCGASIIITSGVGARVLDAASRTADEHGLIIAGTLPKPFRPDALRALLRGAETFSRGRSIRSVVCPEPTVTVDDLRHAIETGGLTIALQPKVTCDTEEVRGFEALARWNHPVAGCVMPDRFIPLAEENGLIGALTYRIIRRALRWLGGMPDPSRCSVAVNISGREMHDDAFADRLEDVCREHGVLPSQVILELTETSAMRDPVRGLELMTRLRVKGFQLALDDFGTGYSSMLQLARLPFSELKLDRSFVSTATTSRESLTIVRSMIDLAHALGLQAVAEGVEDAATLSLLASCGCDLAQGYLIARPLSGEDAVAWLLARDVGVALPQR